jgi:hypothetical protein
VRDLGNANIGIRQQCPCDVKAVVCQLWRTATGTAFAPRGGEACLRALAGSY